MCVDVVGAGSAKILAELWVVRRTGENHDGDFVACGAGSAVMRSEATEGASTGWFRRLFMGPGDVRVRGRSVVSAVVLVLFDLMAFYGACAAFATSPGGADDSGVLVVSIMCYVTGFLAVIAGVLTFIPVIKQWLSEWSLLPPALLLFVALARLAHVSVVY